MITSYKKLASLAVTIGQPQISQRYLLVAQELIDKFRATQSEQDKTPEDLKEEMEDKANFYFQQYLAA